jgi:exodeoxyribonuclease VII small subunit
MDRRRTRGVTTDAHDGTVTDGPAGPPTRADGAPALPADLSFDEALVELQATVAALETGGLPLERTIELYERGVALHDRCSALLGDAELRIRRLADVPGGRPTLVDDDASSSPDRTRGA